MFLSSNAQKTGKNMHLAFKYFELDDIVPVATKIFEKVGLISIVNFTSDTATMTIANIENGEDSITFSAPFNQIAPIVSSTGKQATNEMQALGSSITYMRRYLYMIALDICEPDDIEPMIGTTPTPAPSVTPTPAPVPTPAPTPAPATSDKPLTNADGNASELQIKQLKNLLKKLREADPAQEDWISQIALETKGFTEISKATCEKLVIDLTLKLNKEEK